ncbi:hypothetical protein HP570_10090 [Brevibacillus sp. RS1.1]|uniref:Uncharacterized protein n=1 Tax=Brevibacillus brevis (strain 47 / JCM 6285 / NBRC 100599) TaxID=358681 RepID=C0Z799_BREBN|nr:MULTISPECIES: hypothetical protein [Brevibacillus]NRR02570.1 hypothetical protein [Brevibacillus sp. RS1.1]BAH42142.1 hypothetical protein BBR47_11650 [Brevibacillus brevis NBRC 100599]
MQTMRAECGPVRINTNRAVLGTGYVGGATQGFNRYQTGYDAALSGRQGSAEPFRSVLEKHGYTADNLPTGAVIAVANITECWSVGENHQGGMPVLFNGDEGQMKRICLQEDSFGWFEHGRFVWEMTDVKPFDPVPAKGQQGLWNWGGERDASRT